MRNREGLPRRPRRRAAPAATPRENAFRTLAENSPDLIARLDRAMRHVYVNPVAETVFGLRATAMIGATATEAGVPGEVAALCVAAARRALRSGREQRIQFALPAPEPRDGVRHYSGRMIPEFSRPGRAETVLMIVYDVTQRTRIERERDALLAREQAAREQAEAAARARDHFLAIVSHELRSPLNGIQSWTHVLEQQLRERPAPIERALAGIKLGVEQQVRLIEDLLDATRIVSGQLRLSQQPVRLRPVIESALLSVRAAAQAKGVQLSADLRVHREQVNADPDRLQQILWNLLDNAIKFVGEGGHVWVSAERQGATVAISVRDDGKGITPEFLPHLFDRFRQADAANTRRADGLGLGLALVRHLTELHGGRVSAESPGRGRGATFHVRLPLHSVSTQLAAPQSDDTPLPSLKGVRVLLIDDQLEARESIAALLAYAGATACTASSGREALALLERMEAAERPHVLLCDIAMPDEDGYQALRNIRAWCAAHGLSSAAMPAVALTAFSLREDRIRALAAGYKMHITKPVAPAELIMVIAAAAGEARHGAPSP